MRDVIKITNVSCKLGQKRSTGESKLQEKEGGDRNIEEEDDGALLVNRLQKLQNTGSTLSIQGLASANKTMACGGCKVDKTPLELIKDEAMPLGSSSIKGSQDPSPAIQLGEHNYSMPLEDLPGNVTPPTLPVIVERPGWLLCDYHHFCSVSSLKGLFRRTSSNGWIYTSGPSLAFDLREMRRSIIEECVCLFTAALSGLSWDRKRMGQSRGMTLRNK